MIDRPRRQRKPKECSCGASDFATILYGLPGDSEDLQKKLQRGEVELGGCCVTGHDPLWRCKACGKTYPEDAPAPGPTDS